MKKKKIIIIITAITLLLFIIVFSPWKYSSFQFKEECEDYCQEIKNDTRYGLECQLPLSGCYASCLGIKVNKICTSRSKCFENCDSLCFGFGSSTCAPNIIERKVNSLLN